jgi:hypothetical protein
MTALDDLLRHMERTARAELANEEAMNRAFARRAPDAKPTAEYQEGPLSPDHPCFYSRVDYLRYLAARERAKYHGHVPRPDRCGHGNR